MRPKGLQSLYSLIAFTHLIFFSKLHLILQLYVPHTHSVSKISGYYHHLSSVTAQIDIPFTGFNARIANIALKDQESSFKWQSSAQFKRICTKNRTCTTKVTKNKQKRDIYGFYIFSGCGPRYFFVDTNISPLNIKNGLKYGNNGYKRQVIIKLKRGDTTLPKDIHGDSDKEKYYNFDINDIITGDPKRLTGDKYYVDGGPRVKKKPRDKEAQILWEKYKHLFKPLATLEEKFEKILKLPITTIKIKGVDIDVRIGNLGLPWYIDAENAKRLESLYDKDVLINIKANKQNPYSFFTCENHKIDWLPIPGILATYLPNVTVVEHREDIPDYDYITVLHDSARNYTWTYQKSAGESTGSFTSRSSSESYELKGKKIIPIPKEVEVGPKAYIPKDYFNDKGCFNEMFPRKTLDTGIFRQPTLYDFLQMKLHNQTKLPNEVDEEEAPYGYYREYQNFWQTVEIKDNGNIPQIRYRRLGNSQLSVSELALGTMTFGSSTSETDAFKLLDYAYDNCTINFFDTAELYPLPASENKFGTAEKILGRWIKGRGDSFRSNVIISTKIASRSSDLGWLRDTSLSKENIINAVNNSLKRLGTDYIDLLQFHWPDRYVPMQETGDYEQVFFNVESINDYAPIPMEEQLEAIDCLLKQGKIRAWGLSNETPWGVLKFWHLSRALNIPEPVSVQLNYNLLCRNDLEKGFIELARPQNTGISIIAYGALAGGILTGKYLEYMDATTSARLLRFPSYMSRYRGSLAARAVKEYHEIAMEFGLPNLSVLALRWVYTRPFICNTIIGVSDLYQLRENVHCLNPELPITDLMERKINQIHWKWRDPLRIVQ